MEGEANRPGESAPGAERYVPTDSAEKSATNPGMRRAEQVISGLPPGPAANAARGLPHRAGRQPERSPCRAGRLARRRRAHRDSKTVRRDPGCARNHQEGHLQRVHSSVPAQESPERAKSKAPVISTHHRVPGHARRHRVSRTRKPGVLHEMEDEANRPANPHLAPSGTYQPTAPRRARRIRECAEQNRSSAAYRQGRLRTQPADHLAEQNADHHRVRAEQYISARRAPSAKRFGDGTPERRQPTETNTSTSPPSGLHAYRPVNAPSGTLSPTRRAETSTGQPGVTRRATGHHKDTEQTAPHDAFSTEGPPKAHKQPRRVLHEVEGDANRISFGTWRPAVRFNRRRRDRRTPRGPPRRAQRRLPPSPHRAVHFGPKTPSAARFSDATPERRQCSRAPPRRTPRRAHRAYRPQNVKRHSKLTPWRHRKLTPEETAYVVVFEIIENDSACGLCARTRWAPGSARQSTGWRRSSRAAQRRATPSTSARGGTRTGRHPPTGISVPCSDMNELPSVALTEQFLRLCEDPPLPRGRCPKRQ